MIQGASFHLPPYHRRIGLVGALMARTPPNPGPAKPPPLTRGPAPRTATPKRARADTSLAAARSNPSRIVSRPFKLLPARWNPIQYRLRRRCALQPYQPGVRRRRTRLRIAPPLHHRQALDKLESKMGLSRCE